MSKRAAKVVVQEDKAKKRQKRLTYEQQQRVRPSTLLHLSKSGTCYR